MPFNDDSAERHPPPRRVVPAFMIAAMAAPRAAALGPAMASPAPRSRTQLWVLAERGLQSPLHNVHTAAGWIVVLLVLVQLIGA